MSSFLSEVVTDVLKDRDHFDNLMFVLPSQRACVFLKNELLQQLPQSTFFPRIITIETYIQELADIELIDQTQLLFEFYKIYLTIIPPENQEPFDSFAPWGTIALHDFNEVDSYFVDSEALFGTLGDIKRLNKWFSGKDPSDLAVKHLALFEQLGLLYTKLYQTLKENKTGYQGLIYREAKDNLEFYMDQTNDHVVFAGFNALNKAEEFIFQELLNHQLASVYWDGHESFLSANNIAGRFIRTYKSEWKYYQKNSFKWMRTATVPQKIKIIGAPKNITQIQYAAALLDNLPVHDRTALVLADENVLPLALNSLPESVERLNITMGYPLKDISIGVLFDQLFRLHLNQRKFKKEIQNQWFYKDIIALFSNPYINKIAQNPSQKILKHIKKRNQIFITAETLKSELNEEEINKLQPIFDFLTPITDTTILLKHFLRLIDSVKVQFQGLEKEYLYRFYLVFQQLDTLNSTYGYLKDIKSVSQFFKQLIRNEKLSFEGEPLEGLQLMGMLETRALDFETVIITSMNEGILPKGKGETSFIPFDVKMHFELPTYHEKDAIFSYHFFRLIQRAKNIYLVYNTETDGYGSGEMSRFLTALKLADPSIAHSFVSPALHLDHVHPRTIIKDQQIIKTLKNRFEKGISPSALAQYIRNPLHFYEQVVLGVYEEDEIEETIAARTMGTVIHEVLEALYKPFIGKYLSVEILKNMQPDFESILAAQFKIHYRSGNIKTGKNKLIFEVCKNYLKRFLQMEMATLKKGHQVKILGTELKILAALPKSPTSVSVKLKGIIDRVDLFDGTIRIIDYKTGFVKPKEMNLKEIDLIGTDPDYSKALQMLSYAYLYASQSTITDQSDMIAGILSFKNLNEGLKTLKLPNNGSEKNTMITSAILQEFSDKILAIITEILNPELPFTEKID